MWVKRTVVVLLIAAVAGFGYARFGKSLIDDADASAVAETSFGGDSVTPGPMPAGAPQATGQSTVRGVSALGRLEPQDGILRIAGPSDLVVVVQTLMVEEGDRVRRGQLLATLDTADVHAAHVERIEAELVNARREMKRSQELHRDQVLPDSERDRWETQVAVLEAEKKQAEAELARTSVYSPIDGQVLEVHTHPGERVGEEGIVELAKTQRMYAIAEVYETDIGRVSKGQRATVTSPALEGELTGTVEWISLKVAKQDALGTDPAARKDARVVEVKVRLDDSRAAAALTNLQVEVLIEPSEGSS
jgi:HlyD family secretion protein